MKYIQRKDSSGVETVDEFSTLTEARAMLREYLIADPYGQYYISSRCCKAWRA